MLAVLLCSVATSQAQTFRFGMRADPDIIPANGVSTTSILVQVQNSGNAGITSAPVVRFITSSGTIESQTRLTGGVARVLLRSSTTPGTAIVTAFIGSAREQISVEFSSDSVGLARYLDISGSYVAYGADSSLITASGRCKFDFGSTHIEADVRLDVDLVRERIWAEGNAGQVLIRQGQGKDARELRGDRLYYDLRRRRGVVRRSGEEGAARQEFMGNDFRPIATGGSGANNDATAEPVNESLRGPALQQDEPAIDSSTRPANTPAASVMGAEPAPDVAPPATHDGATPVSAGDETVEAPQPEAIAEKDATKPGVILGSDKVQPNFGSLGSGEKTDVPEISTSTSTVYKVDSGPTTRTGDTANLNSTQNLSVAQRLAVLPSSLAGEGRSTTGAATPGVGSEPQTATTPPAYGPLEAVRGKVNLIEPDPPSVDNTDGYWVAARRLRVYPHDKIQFEKATLFLNGGKVFSMPLYVVSLNGVFNPAQDMVGFNTSGGLTLNIPYFYQASPRGQGTVYLQHAPRNGFAAEKPGFAVAVEQQYWLNDNSNGRLIVDQIGHGGWNLGWQHKLQFSPTMQGSISLDMPRHRDRYLRTSLYKDLNSMQLGVEGFYAKPDGGEHDMQGQFFARLRPRTIGRSGWTMTTTANVTAWNRYPETRLSNGGNGGGIGLPGQGSSQLTQRYRAVVGQTLDLSMQSPNRPLWKGANMQATLRATAFNNSLGRRGVAPGITLGVQQKLGRIGSMQLDYTYDKSGGVYAGANLTHFVSTAVQLNPTSKISAGLFATKSLADRSLYSSASLDYMIAPKWRVGLLADYSQFSDAEDFLDYGWSIGRMIGQREVSVNWSRVRNRIYFELGGFRY